MINAFDTIVFRWFNSWAGISSFFDWAIIFRATYLFYVVIGALLLFFILIFLQRFGRYRRKNLELVILALVSGLFARFIFTEAIRLFYNRPRPFEVFMNARQLVNHNGGGSFPSGHASFAFALATVVAFYYPKTSLLFFAAAISIGFGRIAAGVHWPSDVLAGAVTGIASAWLLRFLKNKYVR